MGEQRREYPAELKRSALEMLRASGKSAAVARDLGINHGLLSRWRREEQQEGEDKKAFTGRACHMTRN